MKLIIVFGAVAQLGEHLLCKQGVVGSIPSSSTNACLGSLSVLTVCRVKCGVKVIRLKKKRFAAGSLAACSV